MIEVKSYFRSNDGSFVLCEEFIGELRGDIDSAHEDFNGAIELSVNGNLLITKSMHDYVDQLWRVLLDGLAYLRLGKHYIGYFPDQAIEISFVNLNDFYTELRVNSLETKKIVVEKMKIFDVLLSKGNEFFVEVKRLLPDANLESDFQYIRAIYDSDLKMLSQLAP